MQITLRKANALQNAIQDHIKTIEVALRLHLTSSKTLQAKSLVLVKVLWQKTLAVQN